jgi:predicted Zn-dependent protease
MKRAFFSVFLLVSFQIFAQQSTGALREYRNGNYERAVDICRSEIAADPSNLEARVIISWSLVALRRYEEARVHALTGWNINRYDPRIVETLGEAYFFQGRNNDALRSFQDYVNLAPRGERLDAAYYYMGELYIRLGKFHHADIALSTAVYYQPRNAAWWTRLGHARENTGNQTGAIDAYEKALALDGRLSDALRGLERSRRNGR